jgi:hypothetical protein
MIPKKLIHQITSEKHKFSKEISEVEELNGLLTLYSEKRQKLFKGIQRTNDQVVAQKVLLQNLQGKHGQRRIKNH